MYFLERIYGDFNETNEPLFTIILHEFPIWLGCRYMLWEGCHSICAPVEITLLEIIHKHKVWFNIGRGFFVSGITKFGCFNNIVYCIDTVCGWEFHKKTKSEDMHISVTYIIYTVNIKWLYLWITILTLLQLQKTLLPSPFAQTTTHHTDPKGVIK